VKCVIAKEKSKISLAGILDISTIDFPGKLCSVVFLAGCPFRCPYCHNHQLIEMRGEEADTAEVAKKLGENYLIDGVCITGGEPTLQPGIVSLVREIKKVKLSVKLDTNGYYPDRLRDVLDYVDYVAIDVKTSPEKYQQLTGREDSWDRVEKSLKLLSKSGVMWEARTTVVPGLVWDEVREIAELLREYKPGLYALQQFNNENTLDPALRAVDVPSSEKMLELAKLIKGLKVVVRCKDGNFEV